jgi:hypothetical protein
MPLSNWSLFGILSVEGFGMVNLLGIDSGGTGCPTAAFRPDGSLIATGLAGPTSIVTNLAKFAKNIRDAAQMALAGPDVALSSGNLKACLGLAGSIVATIGSGFVVPIRRPSQVRYFGDLGLGGFFGNGLASEWKVQPPLGTVPGDAQLLARGAR